MTKHLKAPFKLKTTTYTPLKGVCVGCVLNFNIVHPLTPYDEQRTNEKD